MSTFVLPMLPSGFSGMAHEVRSERLRCEPMPADAGNERLETVSIAKEIPVVPKMGDVVSEEEIIRFPEMVLAEGEQGDPVFEKIEAVEVDGEVYTDEDLAVALLPMVNGLLQEQRANDGGELDVLLEPMLRATVRRALAEHLPASRPFGRPGFFDRILWRMKAMFSSRTYEEVAFEKTHRFQVDEVYLYDKSTLAMISHASCDPGRHSQPRKVELSAKRVALELKAEDGGLRRQFQMNDGRYVLVEVGGLVVMAAVVRGQVNDMIAADLEFSVKRIEARFGERLSVTGTALMRNLQPFLEDCLLIQAPMGSDVWSS